MDITLVPGFNPGPYTGAGNNTYLLRGRRPTLIDAATGKSQHLDALTDGLGGASLTQVLVTHGHTDHANGCSELAQRWPEAVFAKMPWPDRDDRYGVRWHFLEPDQEVDAGDSTLRVVHTPGHAPDHVCFFEETTRTVFCGDLIVAGSTVVVPGGSGGDLAAYLASLEQLLALRPNRVLPAHGQEIHDPAAEVQRYIDHRRRREEQVVKALTDGCTTPEAIAAQVYAGLSESLQASASQSVLAHLIKLRNEGRAQVQDDQWTLT